MTEAEWLACNNAAPMLEYLREHTKERKLRLFAVACLRCNFGHSPMSRLHIKGVRAVEKYADGLISAEKLRTVRESIPLVHPLLIVSFICSDNLFRPFAGRSWGSLIGWNNQEIVARAVLLRHIIGNPFRPSPAPAAWPSTIVQLAQALYDGKGNRLILADALEETGHAELAEHFRKEERHPKGCWIVDMILGKE